MGHGIWGIFEEGLPGGRRRVIVKRGFVVKGWSDGA